MCFMKANKFYRSCKITSFKHLTPIMYEVPLHMERQSSHDLHKH